MAEAPIEVGLVGLGAISKYYLAAMAKAPAVRLRAVCDVDPSRLAAHRTGGPRCYADPAELLRDPTLQAVVIGVPNDQHYRVCKEALLAGKHVCCEKPLTIRSAEAGELVELSRRLGLTLFTVFHRRYNTHVRALLRRIPSRRRIRRVTVRYLERIHDHAGSASWYGMPERCGGGCIADNGPNVYDTLACILGRLDVVSVAVERSADGVDVRAHLTLVAEDGVLAEAALDWDYHAGERKDIEVVLDDGTRLYADMLEGFGAFKSSLFHEYEGAVADFAAHVTNGGRHGTDGYVAAGFVEAAYALAHVDRVPSIS